MSKTFTAVGNHILVRVIQDTESEGGILIPDDVSSRQLTRGVVLDVGDGVEEEIRDLLDIEDEVRFSYVAFEMGDGVVAVPGEAVVSIVAGPASDDDEYIGIQTTDVRAAIFDEIEEERQYQDQKWGGAKHDDNEETIDKFFGYIKEYADGTSERAARHGERARLVKVAALAVAAIESYDRKVDAA